MQTQRCPAPTGTANAVSNQVSLLTQLLQQQHDASDTKHTRPPPPCKPTAIPPPNTTIASVTVGGTTSATIGVEAGAVASGVPTQQLSASAQPLPALQEICGATSRTPKHQKTAVSGTKRYKGYRGKWICGEMEMVYVPRHKFTADMGGYPSDSDGDWRCGRRGENSGGRYSSAIPFRPTSHFTQPQQTTVHPLTKATPTNTHPQQLQTQSPAQSSGRQARRLRLLNEATLLDRHIWWAEGERTTQAKANTTSKQRRAIDHGPHNTPKKTTAILRTGAVSNTTAHLEQPLH
eukprot:CCRYP_009626-RA/>CCRYP_009626-RA protein AED:0.88 eAED:0.59 QI:0/0/0/0.5/1/1/2/0/290